MTAPPVLQADSDQLQRAIGALIWKDPDRILDAVSRLRGSGAVIECGLRGGSMGAAIPMGSRLHIDLGRGAPYRVGEVVAFVQDSGLCVHRVAYLGRGPRASNYVITQGDACFYPDPPVETRRILGSVTEFRDGERWRPAADPSSRDRSRSLLGRALLKLVSGLMEMNVRLARLAARILRVRKENASPAEA